MASKEYEVRRHDGCWLVLSPSGATRGFFSGADRAVAVRTAEALSLGYEDGVRDERARARKAAAKPHANEAVLRMGEQTSTDGGRTWVHDKSGEAAGFGVFVRKAAKARGRKRAGGQRP